MPLYEYQCEACGARSEHLQRIDDPPPESCNGCGKAGTLRRLVSSPAFQFKGSGWYVTDYARSGAGGGKTESADSAPKPAAEAKADAAAPASSPAPTPSSSSDG